MRLLKRRVFEVASIAVFFLLICLQGFFPRPMGLANNGDFPKVLGRIKVWPQTPDQEFSYLQTDYRVDPTHSWNSRIPTVELFLAKAAKALGARFLSPLRFDMRFLGLVHALILALAVWLIIGAYTVPGSCCLRL